jgi:hypothetical protein
MAVARSAAWHSLSTLTGSQAHSHLPGDPGCHPGWAAFEGGAEPRAAPVARDEPDNDQAGHRSRRLRFPSPCLPRFLGPKDPMIVI